MEENKTVSFDKVRFKIKVEQAKRKVLNGIYQTVNWCVHNKELALGIAAAGVGTAKVVGKLGAAKREDYVHEIRHWDPRAGEYYESRRKLNKREKLEMDARYRAGESKIQILNDMGLLK